MRHLALLLGISLTACTATDPASRAVGIDDAKPFAMFPSDRFTVEDAATWTGKRVKLPANAADDRLFAVFPDLVGELESLDGFGTSAPLWIAFDGPLDVSSLPSVTGSTSEDAAVQLIRVSDGAREKFETVYEPGAHMLFVMPFGALTPKAAYVLAVTRRLHGAEGDALRPSAVWNDVPGKGYVASVKFTTQSATDTLGALAMRDVEHDAAAESPTNVTACVGAPHVAWTGKGRLRSPDWRTEESRFAAAADDKVPAGEPADVYIPYLIVVPKGAAHAPTVLVQHGLSGTKEGVLFCSLGELYAAQGFATVAIDGAWHGERAPEGKPDPLTYIRVLFGVWTDGEHWQTKLRFGRDAFRQTALDHVQLANLVKTLAPSFDAVTAGTGAGPDGVPDLSGDVFYNGESMGGIIGSITTAIAPNLGASVLNVPGGRMSNVLFLSELGLYDLIAEPLVAASAQVGKADVRRFIAVYQTVQERGDPINYAPHWWKTPFSDRPRKSVILQETIDDVLVPNRTTEDLARAGGLPQLLPALRVVGDMPGVEVPAGGLVENLAPGVAGGMAQFKTITRGGGQEEASHGTMNTTEAVVQAAGLFRAWLAGAPKVSRAYP